MFHLRPVIEILLRVQYVKSARQPGEPTSEGHIQVNIASLGGTFKICPYTVFKPMVSTFQICQLEIDPMESASCVQRCVNNRVINCAGTKIRNRPTTGGAAGRKVGETFDIESYEFVARRVSKMFKIIPNYSAHLANIIGRFQKNIKVQKQRPVFAASQRRRVELL